MQGECKRDMTASKVRQYIFDRVCLYSESTLEALWGGEMANMPEKYLGCENAGLMGIPVPAVIIRAIDVLKQKSESEEN